MDECFEQSQSYAVRPLNRARWNVLDILEWISRRSVSAHLFFDVDIEEADKLAASLSHSGEKVTITTILLKAIAIAQLDHPASRSYMLPWGKVVVRPVPVAGFTVERVVEGQPAVFFASITDAHTKSLKEIAGEVAAYGHNDVNSVTQLAKETFLSKVPWILRQLYILVGRNVPALREVINPATFGLTSLGKFGLGAPVAPNVTPTILGIGGMLVKPVARDGEVVIKKMMSICLSADIRVLSMYQGARFFNRVKYLLESGLKDYLDDSEKEELKKAQDLAAAAEVDSEKKPEKTEESDPEREQTASRFVGRSLNDAA